MLHAAGLVHEHARNDRDEYVRLIKENLGGNINNINMRKADTYDLNPFDYESIMQYSLKVRISNLTFINYMSDTKSNWFVRFKSDMRMNHLKTIYCILLHYDILDSDFNYSIIINT